MTTTTAAHPVTKSPAPVASLPASEPGDLGAYRDHVLNLRRRQAEHVKAVATVEQTKAQIAALQDEERENAAQEMNALVEAFTKGRDELADATRRAFQDKRLTVARLLADMPFEHEQLPRVEAALADQAAALSAEWAGARAKGRALAQESFEQSAGYAITQINDPRSTVLEVMKAASDLWAYCTAWESFWNHPAGKEILGNERVPHPNGKDFDVHMIWGIAGRLIDQPEVVAAIEFASKLGSITHDEDDDQRVAEMVARMQETFFVPPYAEAERKLERVLHVTPAGRQVLNVFRENPDTWKGYMRQHIEDRVRAIDEAGAELSAIRSAPF